MRALAIDFQRGPRPHPAGWLLLLAGCGLAGVVVHTARETTAQAHAQQARLARASAQLAAVTIPAATPTRSDAAFTAAREALEQARLPWDQLFAALEAAQGQDVGLLTVAPEPARGQIRIEAEARNLGAMLSYQLLLQQQPGLAQVVLVDHSIMKDQPHAPVRFQLLAAWGARHGKP